MEQRQILDDFIDSQYGLQMKNSQRIENIVLSSRHGANEPWSLKYLVHIMFQDVFWLYILMLIYWGSIIKTWMQQYEWIMLRI